MWPYLTPKRSTRSATALVDELTALQVGAIGDWLYLPEVLYMFILVIFVSAGAGPYSFDVAILRLGLQ